MVLNLHSSFFKVTYMFRMLTPQYFYYYLSYGHWILNLIDFCFDSLILNLIDLFYSSSNMTFIRFILYQKTTKKQVHRGHGLEKLVFLVKGLLAPSENKH